MRTLLRYGHINLKQTDGVDGRTILSWTASYGHTQMTAELIKIQGIGLDAGDANGRTPLSQAAGSGRLEIVQLLIATGRVELNSRDQSGRTPLSWAATGGHEEVVRSLLTCHATVFDAQDNYGETALDIARKLERKTGNPERQKVVLALESWKARSSHEDIPDVSAEHYSSP